MPKTFLLAALSFSLSIQALSAQPATRWSGAVSRVLPKITAGPALKLRDFSNTADIERFERVLAPLVQLMQKQSATKLTPEAFLASKDAPALLAAALQGRVDRAQKIVTTPAGSPAEDIAYAKDAESLLLDSYPYLDAETLKSLSKLKPELEKKAEKAIAAAGLAAERMLAESRKATEEAEAAIDAPPLPPAAPQNASVSPPPLPKQSAPKPESGTRELKDLKETVSSLVDLVLKDPVMALPENASVAAFARELRKEEEAGLKAEPGRHADLAHDLATRSWKLLNLYATAVEHDKTRSLDAKLERMDKVERIHRDLKTLRGR